MAPAERETDSAAVFTCECSMCVILLDFRSTSLSLFLLGNTRGRDSLLFTSFPSQFRSSISPLLLLLFSLTFPRLLSPFLWVALSSRKVPVTWRAMTLCFAEFSPFEMLFHTFCPARNDGEARDTYFSASKRARNS